MNTFGHLRPALILAPLVLVSCGIGMPCENTPKSEAVSPDGLSRIVVFSRDCGATTGFNSQGTILPVGQPYPTEGGTVFITDQPDAAVKWDQPNVITVKLKKGYRVFKQETIVGGITINYE